MHRESSKSFTIKPKKAWSRKRRVVAKAVHLSKGANPRFVVTSRSAKEFEKRYLYEDSYCARDEMEMVFLDTFIESYAGLTSKKCSSIYLVTEQAATPFAATRSDFGFRWRLSSWW